MCYICCFVKIRVGNGAVGMSSNSLLCLLAKYIAIYCSHRDVINPKSARKPYAIKYRSNPKRCWDKAAIVVACCVVRLMDRNNCVEVYVHFYLFALRATVFWMFVLMQSSSFVVSCSTHLTYNFHNNNKHTTVITNTTAPNTATQHTHMCLYTTQYMFRTDDRVHKWVCVNNIRYIHIYTSIYIHLYIHIFSVGR